MLLTPLVIFQELQTKSRYLYEIIIPLLINQSRCFLFSLSFFHSIYIVRIVDYAPIDNSKAALLFRVYTGHPVQFGLVTVGSGVCD